MKVIGTEMYDKGMENAVKEFIELAQEKPMNRLVSPSDANVLVHARRTPDFNEVLKQYFWNLPDGVPSVWVLKLKGAKKVNRCSGPDFFKLVIEATKNLPIKHYLCGGAEGVAADLAQTCESWGNTNVVGYHCPPFKKFEKEDYKAIAELVNKSEAHILWVGLGAPKQLYFSYELAKYTNLQFIVPIGAAFDFHTNRVKKAPAWIQKIGMEWFYRMLQEPKRLMKRYLKVVPFFFWYNIVDVFKRNK